MRRSVLRVLIAVVLGASCAVLEVKAQDHPESSSPAGPGPVSSVTNNQPVYSESRSEPTHWYESSEWWLVIVGFITFGFIGWQSCETRRSATAAREGAEAALLNAQAFILSIRPWLVVAVAPVEKKPGYFRLRAVNGGHTPARFLEGCCRFEMQPANWAPPEAISTQIWSPEKKLIVGDDGFDLNAEFHPESILGPAEMDRLKKSPHLCVHVYGRIFYGNKIMNSSNVEPKPYETSWHFAYNHFERTWFRCEGDTYNTNE